MDPGTAGLGLNLAAEGRFKAGEAASILGTTSAVIFKFLAGKFLPTQILQKSFLAAVLNLRRCHERPSTVFQLNLRSEGSKSYKLDIDFVWSISE